MKEVDLLLSQLDGEDDLHAVRTRIVELISQSLDRRHASLDDWEKIHFANAIGSLGLNVDSPRQPGKGWLRLCLTDLKKALTAKENRHPADTPRGIAAEEVSGDSLDQALESISRKIEALR